MATLAESKSEVKTLAAHSWPHISQLCFHHQCFKDHLDNLE